MSIIGVLSIVLAVTTIVVGIANLRWVYLQKKDNNISRKKEVYIKIVSTIAIIFNFFVVGYYAFIVYTYFYYLGFYCG